jgi:hypothetical protein
MAEPTKIYIVMANHEHGDSPRVAYTKVEDAESDVRFRTRSVNSSFDDRSPDALSVVPCVLLDRLPARR